MAAVFSRKLFHDYGKLLFAFVMFLTYLTISQFIIIYQGNLPEEVVWFQVRFHGGWGYVAAGLLIFHFFFPFLILLSRSVKEKRPGARRRRRLRARDALGRPGLADASEPRADGGFSTPLARSSPCRSASAASGSACSRASSAAARCCRSTIRTLEGSARP